MPRSTRKREPLSKDSSIAPLFSLAIWQVRRSKGLLGLIALAVLIAVIFVCMAPLYADMTMTAGLQDAVSSTTESSSLVVTGQDSSPSPDSIAQLGTAFDTYTMQDLQSYLDAGKEHMTVESSALSQYKNSPPAGAEASIDKILLEGNDITQVTQGKHVSLLRGRLPRIPAKQLANPGNTIEVALPQDSATGLQVDVGSTLYTQLTLVIVQTGKYIYVPLKLLVVGILHNQDSPALDTGDPFWHENNLAPIDLSPLQDASGPWDYKLLVADQTLLSTFAQYVPAMDTSPFDPGAFISNPIHSPGTELSEPLNVNWYYAFDPTKISNSQLSDILSTLQNLQAQPIPSTFDALRYGLANMHLTLPIDALTNYQSQLAVAQTPTMGLIMVIFILLVYFVALMTTLLVERQATALALVNSRGASRGQIFGALLLQGSSVCLAALLLGPVLALPAAAGLALIWLSRSEDVAIITVFQNGLQAIFSVSGYALLTVLVVFLVLSVAINQAVSTNVLTLRHEIGRSTHKSLWQRFHLDMIVIVFMMIGYGVSLYLTNANVLDPKLSLLLFAPLVLVRACLIIGVALLLFLRIVPFLLRLGSWWATHRSQGAPAMVALAQLSRSPQQGLRLAMLLSLTTAFAFFGLVFSATQMQRVQDRAIQMVGADFTGALANDADIDTMPDQVKLYSQIPGVKSVSIGYSGTMQLGDQDTVVNFLAVDAPTYARTALSPTNDKTQALPFLMQQLIKSDELTAGQQVVPAIVDESLWNTNHLKLGSIFSLSIDKGGVYSYIYCKVIARIDNLPTQSSPGGMLVDIHAYQRIYDRVINTAGDRPLVLNQVWLHTSDNPTTIDHLRSMLTSANSFLVGTIDRYQLAASLSREPLYVQIMGLLFVGPFIALFLVLIGSFVSAWMHTHDRLLNFALLRALGANSGHVARTLAWEQAIIYTLALVMGVIFGGFLSLTVVPSLIFTSAFGEQITTENFYQLQNIPPVQLIIPILLGIGLCILIAICVVVLGMMIRIVSKPSMAAILRLNED